MIRAYSPLLRRLAATLAGLWVVFLLLTALQPCCELMAMGQSGEPVQEGDAGHTHHHHHPPSDGVAGDLWTTWADLHCGQAYTAGWFMPDLAVSTAEQQPDLSGLQGAVTSFTATPGSGGLTLPVRFFSSQDLYLSTARLRI